MSTPEQQRIRIAKAEGFRRCNLGTWPEQWKKPEDAFGKCVEELPMYSRSLDAIQRAVLSQDAFFVAQFDVRLEHLAKKKKYCICCLTAADWCDCFCAVLDERAKP